MITIRLDRNNRDTWALYPLFEDRVIAFAERYTHNVPVSLLREKTMRRWVDDPLSAGYWLGLDGNNAVAHLLSYLAWDDFQRPHIEFYQLESDKEHSLLPVLATVGAQVNAWVKAINLTFEQQGRQVRIQDGFLTTWHDYASYRRLVAQAGLEFDSERIVMRCSLGERTDNQPRVEH